MPPVIELAGLSVRFGKREILKDLSAALSGRTLGLLGPNGAGKSTLIQTLLGFCPVAGGTARIFGLDIRHNLRQIRAQIGSPWTRTSHRFLSAAVPATMVWS